MSDSSASILRFGIMSDGGLHFTRWQARCLRQLMATPNVVPALIIQNTTPVTSSASARLKRAKPNLLLGQVYRNLISRPPALQPVDLAELLGNVPTIQCEVEKRGKFSEYFSPQDVATIRTYDLAFILRFGFNIIKGDVLRAARYGVWSFHHGDEEKYRGVSEGFWEITRGESVVGAILQRLSEKLDAGTVLRKGHFALVDYSWTKTRELLCVESARWPAQVCVDIQNGVADYVDAPAGKSIGPLYLRPTNLQTVHHGCKIVRNAARHYLRRAFVQTTWGVGVIDQPAEHLLSNTKPKIRYIPDSTGNYRYLADPFITSFRPPDVVCALCEEFDLWSANRGKIVYAELQDGKVSRLVDALPVNVHASYPFVVHHEGTVFCVPEALSTGRIELYRAVEMPHQWVRDRVLVDNFPGIDPTVFQHEGRWWLVATSAHDGPYHNLFLWHAESLFGPWLAHANNPVKCDVRSARPAGTPFRAGGILYRPAQDCSDGYGRRISINAIQKLTPVEFKESRVAVLEPDQSGPFRDGIHTLATASGYTLVDGRRDFIDPLKMLKKLCLAPLVRRLRRRSATPPPG